MIADTLQYRDYQERAVDQTFQEWSRGIDNTLVSSATGTGKSVITCGIAERLPPGARMLYLVHRDSLASQAVNQFRRFTSKSVALEMRREGKGKTHAGNADIIVAGVQSLARRLKRYGKDDFQYLGIDECHRFVGNSWEGVARHFETEHGCGFTATPFRGDGQSLGRFFDSVAFEYPIHDAERDGWLVPFRTKVSFVRQMNLNAVSVRAGDFAKGELSSQLTKRPVVDHVVDTTIRTADGRQGIIFCADVAQAEAVHRTIQDRGETAMIITAKTPPYARFVRDKAFKDGHTQFFVCVGVATEGYDHPGIGVVAMARPTMSRTLHIQMAGRGSRPIEPPPGATPEERRAWIAASKKPHVTIIDFVGNVGRHSGLRSSADLLAGDLGDDVRKIAMEIAQSRDGEVNMSEIVEEAKEEHKRRIQNRSTMTHLDQRFRDVTAEKAFVFRSVPCPFEVLKLDKKTAEAEIPATQAYGENQRQAYEFLSQCKLTEREIGRLSNREQIYLGRQLWYRARKRLCTYPQARRLFNLGYDPHNMTRSAASAKLSRCSREGWLRPASDGPNMRWVERG